MVCGARSLVLGTFSLALWLVVCLAPTPTRGLRNLVVNGDFDHPASGLHAWDTNTAMLNGIYSSYPRSAQLANGKSMLLQRIWETTPADCYQILFQARNALDQLPASNSLEVEFNQKPLTGSGLTPHAPSLPLYNTRLSPTPSGWTQYEFNVCISPEEASETRDLRIRFQGEGYMLDSVQVYPQTS